MMKQVFFAKTIKLSFFLLIFQISGTIDSNNLDEFMDAYKYFRNLYKKIEKKDIEDFTEKYRFSDMENEDLISFYNE